MMQPFYTDDNATIYNADAINVYPLFDDDTFDLLFLDPPYYKVKMDCAWDRQWGTAAQYLEWMGQHASCWKRILKPNGSLFVCASPQMVDGVKAILREHFHVLNTIRWYKRDGTFSRADVTQFRTYCETWEALVFCEQEGVDQTADDLAGFSEAERLLKKRIFGDYLASEWKRAGMTYHQITGAIGAYKNHNHGGAASNWALGHNCPTAIQYKAMRKYLNECDHGGKYLKHEYEYLRTEYEYLRTEYEDLRREYENLRRPFYSTPETFRDTWFYDQVESYDGKHSCEKPIAMLRDVIQTTTRGGGTVGDFFMGSGTTLAAGLGLGRKVVGCDMSAHWCEWAQRRIEVPPLFKMAEESEREQLGMFND